MSAIQATASDFDIPAPSSSSDSTEFQPLSIKHLAVKTCDCCWYNSSTPGCS